MTRSAPILAACVLLLAGCGRLSGGGGGTPTEASPLPPPTTALAAPTEASLCSLVLDESRAYLRWTLPADEGAALALFVGPDADGLYTDEPHTTALKGDALLVSGLERDERHAFGLAAPRPEGGYEPLGEILVGRTLAPVYVDPSASPAGADGLSPTTAYASPLPALLDAFESGEANIWLRGGDYAALSLPPFAEITLSGGFGPGFALTERDPDAQPTRLHGTPGKPVLRVEGDTLPIVLDGLELDGEGVASIGLSASATPVELRDVVVIGALGAGIRLAAAETALPIPLRLLGCRVEANGAEGLSARGAFDVVLRGSRFAGNHQEGADFDDLIAADGGSASLRVRDCQFASNGTDGLDCDLAQPTIGGFFGGLHRVEIDNSRFEQNGAVGLLLDIDYPAGSGWDGSAVLRGLTCRANGLDGLQLDLDAEFALFVHRVKASANGRDGLRLTSDVLPTQAVVSTSAFVGNLGAGLRATEGQASLLVSHSYLAGNAEGGVVSELVTASVASTLAWLQPLAWGGVPTAGSVLSSDELAPPLVAQGTRFLRIVELDAQGLRLAPGQVPPTAEDALELADDDTPRSLGGVVGGLTLQLEPAPEGLLTPALLTVWPPGGLVEEDFTLSPASSAHAIGLTAPGASPMDAGVFGAPLGGVPGRDTERAPLLWLAEADPPLAAGLDADATLRLRFVGGPLDVASVNGTQLVARGPEGQSPTLGLTVLGDLVELSAPGGWPVGELSIELHAGIRSLEGVPLSAPLLLTLQVTP